MEDNDELTADVECDRVADPVPLRVVGQTGVDTYAQSFTSITMNNDNNNNVTTNNNE